MFNKVAVSIFLAIVFSISTPNTAEAQVEYVEGSKIIIVFSADWCVPCQRLHRIAEASQKIKSIVKNKYQNSLFFLKEENRVSDETTRKWFSKAKVKAYPTSVVYRKDKEGIWVQHERLLGFDGELSFVRFLEDGLKENMPK